LLYARLLQIITVAVIAALFCSLSVQAEERYHRLGVDDGLPNATIYSVQQDESGFLWLGSTNSGLLRFDGYRFVEFPVLTASELIQHQTPDVGVVLIANNNTIWAGTWGLGLSRLTPGQSEPGRYTAASGLAGDQVQALLEDNQGRIWAGTTTGLSRIDADNSVLTIGDEASNQQLADQRIWSLTQATDGTVWIGTSAGLHYWRDDSGLSKVIKLDSKADNLSRSNEIRALIHAAGALWVGSRSGLFRFNAADQTFIAHSLVKAGQSEPVLNVLSLGHDSDTLLIGSYTGLYRLHLPTGSVQPAPALRHVNIRSIFQDRSSVLWLGSRESGLYRNIVSSPAFSQIGSISTALAQQEPFSVTAILQHQDALWLGSTDTLFRIRISDGQFSRQRLGSRVNALAAAPSGEIYIATDSGLLRQRGNAQPDYITTPFDLSGVSNRNVRDVKVAADGTLYLGMWGEGVIAWHPEHNTIQRWLTQLSAQSVGNAIQQVFIGDDNQLWVATRYSGLFQLDLRTSMVVQHSVAANTRIELPHNNVQCVSEQDAIVAICSRDGLILYNRISGEQQLLTKQHGLPSDSVLGVLQHDGQLWVITAKGLGYRPPGESHFIHYNSQDGMVSSELNTNAVFANPQRVFFGAISGLVIVQPELLRSNQLLPRPVLSAIVLDHQRLQNKPHGKPWPGIELTPENHTVNFEFSALDFQDPQRNQFHYMLEGINEQWVVEDERNSAFYANLPVGTYPLWLRVSNNHGVFSPAEVVATLHVLPQWWQQRWVIYSLLAAMALLLWLMHRYRLRHIRQINRLLQSAVENKARAQLVLETRVAERTQALEESSITLSLRTKQLERSLTELATTNKELKRLDKLKDEFIATVSHELRTPLTAIRGAVGLIAQKVIAPDNPMYFNMLQTAQTNSERLAQLINDLLDLQKFAAGTFTLSFSQIDLLELTQQAVQAMQPYAKRYQVELMLDAGSDTDYLVYADALRLRQVVDNLISNAIKFSPATGIVMVRLSAQEQEVCFAVEDHGDGIPPAFEHRIFEKFSQADSSDSRAKEGTGLGLAICKKIIENHHGQIGYKTAVGQGTTFWFKLQRAAVAIKQQG
jgi:signal transduction histidine kinase/ligand-binding sensor domain-containing protein